MDKSELTSETYKIIFDENPLNMKAADLDKLYREGDEADQWIFAEMRSNLRLVAGEHYQNKSSKFWDRIRSQKDLSESQKLRLVKNHTGNIRDSYVSTILAYAPSTLIVPNNKSELKDQKAAQLSNSVFQYIRKQSKLDKRIRMFARDFIDIGECHCKIYYDPDAGDNLGMVGVVDETGEPKIDMSTGQQKLAPHMSGAFVYERVQGFDLLRDPEAETFEDSPFFIVRKLLSKDKVRSMTDDQTVLQSLNTQEKEEKYVVFDVTNTKYKTEESKVMVREHYYRPTPMVPNGYYFIAVKGAVISGGDLPFGIWPFVSAGYYEVSKCARFRSPVQRMRPYQVEVNRTASKIATIQTTVGDDKLVMMNGARLTPGGEASGTRAVNVVGGTGATIMKGSAGEQFFPYMQGQIAEMYSIMNVQDYDNTAMDGRLDPHAMLYKSIKNKAKYSDAGKTFEEFVVEITEITLRMAKEYLSEDQIVPMVGSSEKVNLSEFKSSDPLCYMVTPEPVSKDADTMLGKQLMLTQAMQYIGSSLERDDIGKILRSSPFLNDEDVFADFTIDEDMAVNDILALERGEQPQVHPDANHKYMIKKAIHRTKQGDFSTLDPTIQQNFKMYIKINEQVKAQAMMDIQRAEQGFIPTDGYLVKCDFYMPQEEGKASKRAEIPYTSLVWLIKQLQSQGTSLEDLSKMSGGYAKDMANVLSPESQQ